MVRIRPQIDEDIRSVSKYGLEFTNCIETATSRRVSISKCVHAQEPTFDHHRLPWANTLRLVAHACRNRPFYEPRSFQFDAVLPPRASQHDTYLATAKPVVDDVVKGFNGTVMCYGQVRPVLPLYSCLCIGC